MATHTQQTGETRTQEQSIAQLLSTYDSRIFFLHADERAATIHYMFTLLMKVKKAKLDEDEKKAADWLEYVLMCLTGDQAKHIGHEDLAA
jgi:hypothetical protein